MIPLLLAAAASVQALSPAIAAPASFAATSAESWQLVARGSNEMIYIDAASVVRRGNAAYAATMMALIDFDSLELYFMRVQMAFDCAGSTYRVGEIRYYARDRTLAKTEPSSAATPYRLLTPADALTYPLLKFACTGAGGEPVGDPFVDGPARLSI
ncbi:hypothetical protein OF829_15750 [Sphingomonas sp. LB-2]|uniref:surface-adhesin E family protein n=1 Tax=Sphingomonas caeni TaxID=2984949 RepID=UPI002230E68B|nr:surface-adhesin E family protein [Sphingomonas caeni]MCW3848690.1 hypothetical protein [Sphingomonas caeni]